MSAVDDILDQAMRLSTSERADLAQRLLVSVDEQVQDVSADAYQVAWSQEILARSDALARGELAGSDWREAMERVRMRMVERRSP